jgi:hypothetical protein
LVTPQHFIAHLYEIASIEELVLPERFVVYEVGIRMERAMSAERLDLSLGRAVRFTGVWLLHLCQAYYVQLIVAVKMIL